MCRETTIQKIGVSPRPCKIILKYIQTMVIQQLKFSCCACLLPSAPTGASRRQLVPAGANWCRPAPVGAGASWCRRRCAILLLSVLSTGAGRRCLATPVPARVVQGVGACGKKLQQICFALILPLGGEPCATSAGPSVAKQWRPVPLLSAL